MVVRAPRGPTETEVPRFPMLIETPGRIVIRLWNLKPILNFLVSIGLNYTISHRTMHRGNRIVAYGWLDKCFFHVN